MSRYVTCRKCGMEIDKEFEAYDYDEKSRRYTCLSCSLSVRGKAVQKAERLKAAHEQPTANPWLLKTVIGGFLFLCGIILAMEREIGPSILGCITGAALVTWGIFTKPSSNFNTPDDTCDE